MDLYPVVHAWDQFLFPVFLYAFGIIGVLALAGKSKSKLVVEPEPMIELVVVPEPKPELKAEPVVLPEPEPVVKPMVEPVVVTTTKRRGRPPKIETAGEQPVKKTRKKSAAARAAEVPSEVPSEVPDYAKGVCRDTLKCIFEDT